MKLVAFLSVFAWSLAGFSGAQAQTLETNLIKFPAHVVAPNTPKGRAADEFKRLAEQGAQGRVRVEVYHTSALYPDREEIEGLAHDAVQMPALSLSMYGPMGLRAFARCDRPYILPNKETLYCVMDGAVGKRLFATLEPRGSMGLAYWDHGFKQMSANRPLGVNPRLLVFSEVPAALRDGAVDGTENPVAKRYTLGMHEAQKLGPFPSMAFWAMR